MVRELSTYTTEVICLKAFNYGEADKILHFYSPDHGRISAIAKGVKRAKSKMAGACELLNISEVQLSHGKNLDMLCQYQPKETFIGIRSDILKLSCALLFVELVNLVAQEQDMDSHLIFEQLKTALEALDQAFEEDVLPITVEFQLAVLHAAGYHPNLTECIFTGEQFDWSAPFYCFSPEMGGITTPDRKNRHHGKWVNVSTSTLRLLGKIQDEPGVNRRQANLLKVQKFLRYYFQELFERNLHAYDFMFSLLEPISPQNDGALAGGAPRLGGNSL